MLTEQKQRSGRGLDAHRRIDPNMPENILAAVLSQHGLSARAIEHATGLSVGAISYRNRKAGVQLRDYREGRGAVARRILVTYSVGNLSDMSPERRRKLRSDFGVG